MYLHANAKLGLAGRVALVRAIEGGLSLKAAAAAFSVSPATAHRWWHRWLEASEEARATLSCLFDRSSRPRRSPRQLPPELAELTAHGITAHRLMTDNAWSYARSRTVRQLLARREIRHLTTKPYRPRTNGKVERLHQTMAREWAYGLTYRSHHARTAALPHWLNHYNTTRPHSSLGGQPPISRVHNVCGQDS